MNNQNNSRHGCLSVYLILLILTTVLTTFGIILFLDEIKGEIPNYSVGLIYITCFSAFIEIGAVYLIFKWEKIGFYGVWFSYMINLYVSDKMGVMDINVILGLIIRFGLLYGILQIKSKGVSGWKNLSE